MSDYDVLLRLARTRRSPYAFDDAPVSDQTLARVFEVARWAPSSYNEQPWRFVVGHRGDEGYRAIADALGGRNPDWALTAPVLGLALAASAFERGGKPNAHRQFDTGAAGFGLALAAHAEGLGVHWMAGIEGDRAARALGAPDGFDAVAGFALGRPADDPEARVPGDLAERARRPKTRRPLDQTVFAAGWVPLPFDDEA